MVSLWPSSSHSLWPASRRDVLEQEHAGHDIRRKQARCDHKAAFEGARSLVQVQQWGRLQVLTKESLTALLKLIGPWGQSWCFINWLSHRSFPANVAARGLYLVVLELSQTLQTRVRITCISSACRAA